jgi:hypothetical protein
VPLDKVSYFGLRTTGLARNDSFWEAAMLSSLLLVLLCANVEEKGKESVPYGPEKQGLTCAITSVELDKTDGYLTAIAKIKRCNSNPPQIRTLEPIFIIFLDGKGTIVHRTKTRIIVAEEFLELGVDSAVFQIETKYPKGAVSLLVELGSSGASSKSTPLPTK